MSATAWTPLFALAGVGLLACVIAALATTVRAKGALGARLCATGSEWPARTALLLLLAAACWWLLRVFGTPELIVFATLVVAVTAVLLLPPQTLEVCGTEGIQRGWTVRAFSELEEWRLVGDHLRFRVGERWLAIQLPREFFERTLETLRSKAPERESPFK